MTLNLTVALSDVTILSGKCWRYVSDLELDCSSFRCDTFVWQMLRKCLFVCLNLMFVCLLELDFSSDRCDTFI